MTNRKPRPYCRGWAWSNYGILQGVESTRSAAIVAVENHVGEPWSKAREYMEVWKCRVVPIDAALAAEKGEQT